MSNINADAVATLREMSEEALEQMDSLDISPFTVASVEVDRMDVTHGDAVFTEEARKSFLSVLKVKPDFPDIASKVDDSKWKTVIKTLQDSTGSQELFALRGVTPQGHQVIKRVYAKKADHAAAAIQHRSIMGSITGALTDADRKFDVRSVSFDQLTSEFSVTLVEDRGLDMGASDVWRPGSVFTFSAMEFSHMPFFLRLSCDNGATTQHKGFKSIVSQKRHSIVKVADLVRKSITDPPTLIEDTVRAKVGLFRTMNASIFELEHMRKMFKRALKEDEELFQRLDAMYFDDAHLYRSYSTLVADQTQKWKQTADSGVNAYDLFNLMTWIASHPSDTGISSSDQCLSIQLAATNFLFKETLDLQDVAPKIQVESRRIPEMN